MFYLACLIFYLQGTATSQQRQEQLLGVLHDEEEAHVEQETQVEEEAQVEVEAPEEQDGEEEDGEEEGVG
jgi:hypothetical protein